MGRNGHAFFLGFLDRNGVLKESELHFALSMDVQGLQFLEV